MMVEDNDTTRTVLGSAIEQAGHQVTLAANGETALRILTRAHAQQAFFDVVVTDIRMGDIDGMDVLRMARQQRSPPAVILLTGYASTESAVEALRTGAHDYLFKPCNPPELLDSIARAIAHRRETLQQAQQASAFNKIASMVGGLEDLLNSDNIAALTSFMNAVPSETLLPSEQYLRMGDLSIDTDRRYVTFQGQQLHVTPTEYLLLVSLMSSQGRVVEYHDIAFFTHGCELDDAHSVLRWHVRNLNRKLGYPYIEKVRGRGYMLVCPQEEAVR